MTHWTAETAFNPPPTEWWLLSERASPFLGSCPDICSVQQEWIIATCHAQDHLEHQLLTGKAWHKNVLAQNLSWEESAEPCQNVT